MITGSGLSLDCYIAAKKKPTASLANYTFQHPLYLSFCSQCDQEIWSESCRLEEAEVESQWPSSPKYCHRPDTLSGCRPSLR